MAQSLRHRAALVDTPEEVGGVYEPLEAQTGPLLEELRSAVEQKGGRLGERGGGGSGEEGAAGAGGGGEGPEAQGEGGKVGGQE